MSPPGNENERFITAAEAAEYLGTHKQTIYNKVHRGEIPFHKRDGLLRFRRSDLDAWMRGEDQPAQASTL